MPIFLYCKNKVFIIIRYNWCFCTLEIGLSDIHCMSYEHYQGFPYAGEVSLVLYFFQVTLSFGLK